MEGIEEKLNAVLSNPQMMQQIMSMAQAMGGSTPQEKAKEPPKEKAKEPPKEPHTAAPMPEIDLGMLQKMSGLARQSGIDKEQQTLLHALRPYLSRDRIGKLEKAMRAAKMAKFASSALSQGGFLSQPGR